MPRARKLALLALVIYLLCPIDVVPDFVPVVGQHDDTLLLALVRRGIVGRAGSTVVSGHWPGPEPSLQILLRLARGSALGPA